MATGRGRVKKTDLAAYRRPLRSGLIAVKLRQGDELVDVVVTKPGDEVVLATASGMAIRFRESDVRPMGRNASGVKGITLVGDDHVVGMVVADPEAALLTACANGYGKRTPFGPNSATEPEDGPEEEGDDPAADTAEDEENGGLSSQHYYRTQGRGGKGLRDIKTAGRNGPVIGIVRVRDEDEIMMITARGQIQRVPASDISIIGRNTMGVRIMNLDDDDTLVAVKRVPRQDNGDQQDADTGDA
jgi:DNA gyrase subunit A